MREYWFEIVRRPYDRYSWVFVRVRDGRRRVLASSGRDYRSRKRVRRAISLLKEAVVDADVVDASGETDPFELPTSTFEIAPFALPLVVGQPPAERTSANGRRRRSGNRLSRAERPDSGAVKDTPLTEAPVATAAQRGSADDDVTSTPEAPAGASATRAARRSTTKKGAAGASASRPARRSRTKKSAGRSPAADETA